MLRPVADVAVVVVVVQPLGLAALARHAASGCGCAWVAGPWLCVAVAGGARAAVVPAAVQPSSLASDLDLDLYGSTILVDGRTSTNYVFIMYCGADQSLHWQSDKAAGHQG